ncbi:unnamed protein product [Rotaria magnacalcarata]|uniref:CCHC-type domain-containing protein n=1 Tax=Rotaria magnacalcarata TaxID=392030 RepID=A0A815ETP4_9BILA|nr:unnamed protein product [Rotaria magnacalcarata]CAF1549656.1 unnamed protein product [Rotaria magnacalcarata]CAF2100513.1 unnamed protein product [Rotaria magnacalcarata]CAF3845650.1 unnamed protein product [Rotaria magnacalcarata]CAF3916695.1 unnamed protein product [Rotaria magnacalcarata]
MECQWSASGVWSTGVPPFPPWVQHPTTINLQPVNSPARSIRRTLSDDMDDDFTVVKKSKKVNQYESHNNINKNKTTVENQGPLQQVVLSPDIRSTSQNQKYSTNSTSHHQITIQSERYATTRYPFSPFIIRFPLTRINEQKIVEELIEHIKHNWSQRLEFFGYRRSTIRCGLNECDLLLFVKDSNSFCTLYDDLNWPNVLNGNAYIIITKPSFPAQLSLIIKNVDLRLDFNEFILDIKTNHKNVKNVIRMKNKFHNEIRLVKIETLSSSDRNELLDQGKIVVNSICYDIVEYLAPVNVLICSKCMGLGHFKKQCKEKDETCKICGLAYQDLKLHQCTQAAKCVHCGGNHNSNVISCPVIKQFRADLTKKLFTHTPYHQAKQTQQMTMNNNNYVYNPANFPPMPAPQQLMISSPNNIIILKLDELNENVMKINNKIEELARKTDKLEKFIEEKIESDMQVMNRLQNIENNSELNNNDIGVLLDTVQNMVQFILKMNKDSKGRPQDADLKYILERQYVQLAKCIEKQVKNKK